MFGFTYVSIDSNNLKTYSSVLTLAYDLTYYVLGAAGGTGVVRESSIEA